MNAALSALKHEAAQDPKRRSALLELAANVAPARHRSLPLPSTLPSLGIVCCSIRPEIERRFRAEVARAFGAWPTLDLCILNDARSLAEAYNRGAEACRGEWIVFCHDDIRFLRDDFAARLARAMDHFDVFGPAGATRLQGPAVLWGGPETGRAQVSYPLPDGRFLATLAGIGSELESAQALDGLFVVARREAWAQVRFDAARFDGFHLYDLDFSYACHRAGWRVGIAQDLHILHDSGGNFDSRWWTYAERFVRKYNLVVSPSYPEPSIGVAVSDRAIIPALFDALNDA